MNKHLPQRRPAQNGQPKPNPESGLTKEFEISESQAKRIRLLRAELERVTSDLNARIHENAIVLASTLGLPEDGSIEMDFNPDSTKLIVKYKDRTAALAGTNNERPIERPKALPIDKSEVVE